MAAQPAYAAKPPYAGSVAVSATANTAYHTPGSTGQETLFTAGATGAQIDAIDIVTQGTPSACVVNLWRWAGGTGTVWYLVNSFTVTATATKKARRSYTFPNLKLNANDKLTVTCTVASQLIQANAYGGNF